MLPQYIEEDGIKKLSVRLNGVNDFVLKTENK
jgi:hypothetical protein